MNGGDLTRSTFRVDRHYSGVRMQQGRVQLDADWNEQLDLTAHRDRAEALDVIGPAGVPKVAGGFEMTTSADGTDLLLSPGRAWVAGHLCEADGGTTAVTGTPTATQVSVEALVLDGVEIVPGAWIEVVGDSDSVLARATAVDVAANTVTLDGSIAALTGALRLRRRYSYAVQPDLPLPEHTVQASVTDPRVLDLPAGTYLAYLDVWERSITSLDDATLSEPALGTDTTTRSKVVWQVRLLDLAGIPDPVDCDTNLATALAALAPPTGVMAARAEPPSGSADACRPTPAGGYVGLENQLYRVHVHEVDTGRPVILWSRENASVATTWVSSVAADTVQVASIGKDAVLGFQPGDWVELYDDQCVLDGRPGTLVRLLNAREDKLTLDVATASGSTAITDFLRNPQVRRWDSPGAVTVTGDDWVELENGVQVRFPAGGTFRRQDHWLVPARSVIADVDWPRDSGGEPLAVPPSGVRHDTGRLAIVTRSDSGLDVADCRDLFPSLTTLTADDVTVRNDVCNLAGVETVQDAIDALCRANDLRRHNRLLHGYGIVCGLAVHCGSGEDGQDDQVDDLSTDGRRKLFEADRDDGNLRRFVTVAPGSALDADGNDLDVREPIVVDVLRQIEALDDKVLDDEGDGEVSVVLRSDGGGPTAAVTRFVAREEREWLTGTLVNDIYADCILKPLTWVRAQLDPGSDLDPRAYLLRTALVNLLTGVANPKSGGNVFVAENEHEVLVKFYQGLRKRLRSETFCAMFDDARPYPDYPASLQGVRTIGGSGNHDRVRTRPESDEVWTTGGGINPVQPATMINRYSVSEERLIARIDPVSGLQLDPGTKSSTATAAVSDIAFSPDGGMVAVAMPTRDGNDTFFRVGDISGSDIRWRPGTTICGVKLVTLATTRADREHVYAVGLRRTKTEGKAFSLREYTGAGIWQIPWGDVPDGLGPLPSTAALNTVGHLVISPTGDAVFTLGPDGGTAERYDRLASMSVPGPSDVQTTALPTTGADDIALVPGRRVRGVQPVWAVVGSGSERELVVVDRASGQSSSVFLGGSGRIALQTVNDRLLVTDSATSLARVLDTSRREFIERLQIPVQAGPISTTAALVEPRQAVVLNLLSNSLSVVDVRLVMGDGFDLDPLLEYRHAAIEAFADLVGGLAQYLKDCICDHLLVRCPPRLENLDLDLAAVSIRGGSVYKVCNFSRRRYVKSFPTVGYWLSLVPVLPALHEVVGQFCCRVLTEEFNRYSAAGRADAGDRVDVAKLLRLLQIAQDEDPLGRLRGVNGREASSFLRGANTGAWGDDDAAEPSVAPPTDDVTPPVRTRVPTHQVVLRNLLASPAVRDDLRIVRAEPTLGRPKGDVANDAAAAPVSSADVQALVARVASLEAQVAALEKPPTPARKTTGKREK